MGCTPQSIGNHFLLSANTFTAFLKEIQQQISDNKQLYDEFLSPAALMDILAQFKKLYIDHGSALQILQIIFDFMSFCKNQRGCNPPLQTTFTKDYQRELSQKWQKVREPLYFNNKNQLRLLNFIIKKPASSQLEYPKNFPSLEFDLSIEETRSVAGVVKKMCEYDLRSFCYLSNYLYSSCINLQKNGRQLRQIQSQYKQVLDVLYQDNPPAPPIQAEESAFAVHPTIKNAHLIPKIQIDLRKYSNNEEKQFALEKFIMKRAQESNSELERFNRILKNICYNSDGYRFKSGVKIKSKNERKSLTRIKQKILGNVYNQVGLQRRLQSMESSASLEHFVDIYSSAHQQFIDHKNKMNKLFEGLNSPLPYKISDLLRGKCIFSNIGNINKCCSEIKAFIEGQKSQNLKLVEIDNRLRQKNSDLVMKILFGNTIAELQLVKDLNLADYEFHHKIYELKRSKFYTPLTQLAILNEEVSKDYFLELKAFILSNAGRKAHDYEEKITYDEALSNFKTFFHRLDFKINFYEVHKNEIDIQLMRKQIQRFNKIRHSQTRSALPTKKYHRSLNNGIYSFQMKDYAKAEQFLSSSFQQIQSNYKYLFQIDKRPNNVKEDEKEAIKDYLKIAYYRGMNAKQMGDYSKALQFYKKKLKCEQVYYEANNIEKAETLDKMGIVYWIQGNLPKALEIFKYCLSIKQIVNGVGSIDTAITLRNIGNIYWNQGNYSQALTNYSSCLKIQQEAEGKGSINTALTFNNIGNVYRDQGDYQKAKENYEKCLQIQQNYKGKGSIDTVFALNNMGLVYSDLRIYRKALQSYQKCIQIVQKVKGKDHTDVASILLNIARIYKNIKEYKLSLNICFECLRILKSKLQEETVFLADIFGIIGLIFFYQCDYPKALQYDQMCLEIRNKIKGPISIDVASILTNIGLVYSSLGDLKEASRYYNQSRSIYEKLSVKNIEYANVLFNLGSLYYRIQSYGEACQLLQECLPIYQKYQNDIWIRNSLLLLLGCKHQLEIRDQLRKNAQNKQQ